MVKRYDVIQTEIDDSKVSCYQCRLFCSKTANMVPLSPKCDVGSEVPRSSIAVGNALILRAVCTFTLPSVISIHYWGSLSKILYSIIRSIPIDMVYHRWHESMMVQKNKSVFSVSSSTASYGDSDKSVARVMGIAPSVGVMLIMATLRSHESSFGEIVKAFSEKFLRDFGIFFRVPFHVCLLSSSSDALRPHPFDRRRRRPGTRYQSRRGPARGETYGCLRFSATME